MALKSINPATGEVMQEFEEISNEEVETKIERAHQTYGDWRVMTFEERGTYFKKAAKLLRSKARQYGEIMSQEMGKPVSSAVAEAEKCAWVCEFYAEKAAEFLVPEKVETDAGESYVQYDPLGVVLAVMPWNYPFWQLFRAAAPIMMAGNTMILKHASNVPHSAQVIEEVFKDAGFPEGAMTNLAIGSSKVKAVIENDLVMAATLTGSEYAGSQVAMQCGEQIKPTLLELGGSDPFIVLEDANIEDASTTAVSARFQNNGQSCIAAKRFIVVEAVFDKFVEKFKEKLLAKKFGNPMEDDTVIGPLATEQIMLDIEKQVEESVEAGAEVVCGAKRGDFEGGFYYEPTILAEVEKGMPVYDEETFGPVAAVIKVKDEDEAMMVANDTQLGLGSSIWTANTARAKLLAKRIDAGAVFINGMVKSDPRLPFGGVKKSGYGRELSHHGIKEFTNAKTVWIAK